MNTAKAPTQPGRPQAGDKANYPGGPGEWRDWSKLNDGQRAQAKAINRKDALPGSMCLISLSTARVLRIVAPEA